MKNLRNKQIHVKQRCLTLVILNEDYSVQMTSSKQQRNTEQLSENKQFR